ncbi:hypothetical protein PV663_13660, partial [Streptomyces sp. FL07-04A]|nr:hypothetical protein [Streptomyces sp. FL07-04A]
MADPATSTAPPPVKAPAPTPSGPRRTAFAEGLDKARAAATTELDTGPAVGTASVRRLRRALRHPAQQRPASGDRREHGQR